MERAMQRMTLVDHIEVPETYRGYKLDRLLAYNTPRFVSIEDRRLGCMYYVLTSLVVAWVVGFQILYGNEHYKLWDVLGESRITIQQPTVNGCNPRSNDCQDKVRPRRELPYCKEPHNAEGKLQHSSTCGYFDMLELTPNGPGVNSLFVPTRIDTSVQEFACWLGVSSCSKMWRGVNQYPNTFVAGIEDYTLLFRSSYMRKGIRGHSESHVGYYYRCTDPSGKVLRTDPCEGKLSLEEIKCLPGLQCGRKTRSPPPMRKDGLLQIGNLRPRRFNSRGIPSQSLLQPNSSGMMEQGVGQSEEGVYAIPSGDVFTVRKLVELAGLDLDTSLDEHGTPLRVRGTAITVSIEFTNIRPFGMISRDVEVGYAYRVVESPLGEVKEEVYGTRQPSNAQRRVMENRHGLMLTGKVTGSFGTFDVVYLLIMLTTSLALFGVAKTCVDFVALQLPSKHQMEFQRAKYAVHRPFEQAPGN